MALLLPRSMAQRLAACGTLSGRRINASNMANTTAFAPMARASVKTATMVKPGDLRNTRRLRRTSCISVSTKFPPRASWTSSLTRSCPPNSMRARRSASARTMPERSRSSARCWMWERSSSSISAFIWERWNRVAMREGSEGGNVVRRAPVRLEQSLPYEAKQAGIKRALFDQQRISGNLADAQKDAVSVQWAERDRSQNEEIESAGKKLGLVGHYPS